MPTAKWRALMHSGGSQHGSILLKQHQRCLQPFSVVDSVSTPQSPWLQRASVARLDTTNHKCHAAHVPLVQRMAVRLHSRTTVQSCRSRIVSEVVRTGRSE